MIKLTKRVIKADARILRKLTAQTASQLKKSDLFQKYQQENVITGLIKNVWIVLIKRPAT